MKKSNSIILGILLIVAGGLLALNSLGITEINIFFDGWWTLFIIVPCAVSLFTKHEKADNLFGIIIGVILLLCCQDVIEFSVLWKLFVPAVIVFIGLKLLFNGIHSGSKANDILKNLKEKSDRLKSSYATFGSCDISYDGEVFEGTELNAVFGGINCDLRNAIIENDCAIKIYAIFGGVDVLVPNNVNVKIASNSLFGGVSNDTVSRKDAPTVYINATCLFGGAEIK